MIRAIRDVTVGLFRHLEITSKIDVDKRINYIERILRREALNKYRQVLSECKDLEKGIDVDQWNMGAAKNVTMEQVWDWAKVDAIDRVGYLFTGPDLCTYFEKEIWLELGKIMGRKHFITFQDHVKFIHNDIVMPFRVGILQYANHVRDMHDLAKYLPPPLMKGSEYYGADWTVHDK